MAGLQLQIEQLGAQERLNIQNNNRASNPEKEIIIDNMKQENKVISAKVPITTYNEIEEVAEALQINKNELIYRAVQLFVASYNYGVTECHKINNQRLA